MNDPLISIGLGFLGLLGLIFIPNNKLKIFCIVAAGIFFYNTATFYSNELPAISQIIRDLQRFIENALP